MKYIGEFSFAPDLRFTTGAKLVLQTNRGIEIGDHVPLTCSGCPQAVTPEQVRTWVDGCGKDSFIFGAGRVLREATAADLAEYARIQSGAREHRDLCQGIASRHRLPMKIVECECLFGGERIIFYFASESRVDFREMVKDLAWEFRTRIEMRQVGARDEARLLADFETCGRECCCKLLLKTLRPVTMKMAKLQKATLDPSKVSGRCGRLKCCLRYEHVGYQELDERLVRQGVRIRTAQGEGVVVARQVLTQIVQIRRDDDTLVAVPAEEILATHVAAPARPLPPASAGGAGTPAPAQVQPGGARPPRTGAGEGRVGGPGPAPREAGVGRVPSGAGGEEAPAFRPPVGRRRGRRPPRQPAAADGGAPKPDSGQEPGNQRSGDETVFRATTGKEGTEREGVAPRRRSRGRRRRGMGGRRSGPPDATGPQGGDGPGPSPPSPPGGGS
ncbi:MAG TPA: regulatory iron-sulfur-containing complex subunit RicT [Phycisphaerae bacterium]|nr:regulatory iron-sulfur-containing complex subunit RicT [Phycisphaerae bacterium]HNU44399.1 regulatory iron-sulfur-containing complex subunit RicT [Phycisphaerae bacterium]